MRNPVEGWTDARFKAFIISTLRGGMRRFPNKWQCLKDSYVGKKRSSAGREAAHYRCAVCSLDFTSSNVQIDHIDPVVNPDSGLVSWDEYIDRLFCPVTNLQTLCLPCHKAKTNKEKLTRTSTKKPPLSVPSKPSASIRKRASMARKSGVKSTRKPK